MNLREQRKSPQVQAPETVSCGKGSRPCLLSWRQSTTEESFRGGLLASGSNQHEGSQLTEDAAGHCDAAPDASDSVGCREITGLPDCWR